MEGKTRRAISPLLATVLLIGITVAAGGAIFAIYNEGSAGLGTGLNMRVDNANGIKTSSSSAIGITLRNTGSVPWETVTVTTGSGIIEDRVLFGSVLEVIGNTDWDEEITVPLIATAIANVTDADASNAIAIGNTWFASTDPVLTFDYDTDIDIPTAFTDDPADTTLDMGMFLDQPIAAGESISFDAKFLFEDVLSNADITDIGDLAELNAGDKLVLNIQVEGSDGNTFSQVTTVTIRGA